MVAGVGVVGRVAHPSARRAAPPFLPAPAHWTERRVSTRVARLKKYMDSSPKRKFFQKRVTKSTRYIYLVLKYRQRSNKVPVSFKNDSKDAKLFG